MPYPCARAATLGFPICLEIGVEIAHWLFSHKKTIGSCWIAAKLSDSCHSPSLVDPSPNWQSTMRSCSPRYLIAYAAPTACGHCAARIDEIDAIPFFLSVT